MTRARDLANLIGSGNYTTETLTATAGQTVFTPSNSYTPNFIQIYMNGLLLDDTVDYTATNGTTITLTVAASAGDEMEVVTYNTFSVGDAITQTEADNRYVNVTGDTMSGNLSISGKIDAKDAPWTDFSGQVQFGETGVIANYSSGANVQTIVGSNVYYNGGYRSIKAGAYVNFMNAAAGEFTFNSAGATASDGDLVTMAERMKIDSAGRVTMPYQPAFRAHTFTPLVGSGTIIYTVASHNIGSHYNVSNGKFTAPVSGVYHFDFSVLMEANSATDYIRVLFAINGATDTRHGDTLTGGSAGAFTNYNYHSVQMSHSFYLNANDTVEIKNNNPNNSTYQSEGIYGAFSGHLIG